MSVDELGSVKITALNLATRDRYTYYPTEEDCRIAQAFYDKAIFPYSSHPLSFPKTYTIKWRPRRSLTVWWSPLFGKYDQLVSVGVNFRFPYKLQDKESTSRVVNLALLRHPPFGTVMYWPSPKHKEHAQTDTLFYTCWLP